MKTICKTTPAEVSFIFADAAPELHAALRHLYYAPLAEGFAKRFPASTPNLERIYANFERDASAMLLQAARLQPVDWEQALSAFLQRVDGTGVDWWLTGSAALAVRGLDVAPGDLDLVVDDAGALRLADLLADTLIEPLQPSPGWIWNHFGRAFLHARVEWVGRVNESADDPLACDYGQIAAARLDVVRWHGYDIRVPPLDLQLAVSQRRGLTGRVAIIERFLRQGN